MFGIPSEHDYPIDKSQHVSQQQIEMTQPCPTMEHEDGCGDGIEKSLYFPQSEEEHLSKLEKSISPFNPWVTGKVTCSLKDGITGLRPVADQYSITLFGPNEWRTHNLRVFEQSDQKTFDAQTTANSAKQCVEHSYKVVDKAQLETTENLKTRANVVHRWKMELEHAIALIAEEIGLLETEHRRIKQSLSVLTIPMSIATEFLQLRSLRLESDLIRDNVEEQLVKETALYSEIRDLLNRTREQIELQMMELKAAKTRMESDWSDKTQAYNIDSVCANLSNDSSLILWKAGATRFPADQSTPTSYEHFTQEAIAASEMARQKSIDLRSTLNAIYTNSIKELRDQATRVDVALAEKVKLTQDVLQQLEKKLLNCLQELANVEKLIEKLQSSMTGLNNAMKLAQTRLDNRLTRRNVESCRDAPQYVLVEEVKSLGDRISAMLAEIKSVEESQAELIKTRGVLEHEIMVKRKTLYIDKERGQLLRSCFPSATALSGY